MQKPKKKIKIVHKRVQIVIPIRACIVQTIVIRIKVVALIATDQSIVILIIIAVAGVDIVRTIGIQIIALELVVHDIGQTIGMHRHQCFRQHVVYHQDIRQQAADDILHQSIIALVAIQPVNTIQKIDIQTHGPTVGIPKWMEDIIQRP